MVAPSTTRRLLHQFAAALPDPAGRPARRPARRPHRPGARGARGWSAGGRSNTEIAADLVIAEATVKTHVGRLLAKTGSRDRVHLVVLAYETGLVRPG